jgi:anti-anti-sigma factor
MSRDHSIRFKEQNAKLTLKSTEIEQAVVIHCRGCLQGAEAAAALSNMAGAILDERRNLILDFEELQSVDSAGIGELVLISMRALAARKEVAIARPQPQVLELLDQANVSALFRTYSTVEEALNLPEEVV